MTKKHDPNAGYTAGSVRTAYDGKRVQAMTCNCGCGHTYDEEV